MATPNEKLAESLDVLKALQEGGRRVFRSDDLSRVHRERLVENGFLQEVIKGWLISTSPGARGGESTPWYASFWEFCAVYSAERFGNEWHLSAEESLWLHGEKTVIPEQVVVCSPKGTNHLIKLLYGTSLYDLKVPEMPPAPNLVMREALRLFSPAASLVGVGETFFARNPVESQVVLASLANASDLLRLLLDGGNSTKAGYLAGAFRRIGRPELADEIVRRMKRAGYAVRKSDQFEAGQAFGMPRPGAAPIVGRLEMMWQATRDTVIKSFPKAPGLPKDSGAYLQSVDEIYLSDAYHSLSIEGYSVTPDLIEKVRQGGWNPDRNERDRKDRDTLAARGYWLAFQVVKESVGKVLNGKNPRALARAGTSGVVRGIVPALRDGRTVSRGRSGRIPEQCCIPANVPLCAAALGGGARRHAGVLRSPGKRTRALSTRRARALALRLHSSVPGWQRAHGAFPDERDAGVGRVSVDAHSREGPQRLPCRARPRQHRCGHQAIHDAHSATGALGAGET